MLTNPQELYVEAQRKHRANVARALAKGEAARAGLGGPGMRDRMAGALRRLADRLDDAPRPTERSGAGL